MFDKSDNNVTTVMSNSTTTTTTTTTTNTTGMVNHDDHDHNNQHHYDPIDVYSHIIGGSLYLVIGLFMARLCYVRLRNMATTTSVVPSSSSSNHHNNNKNSSSFLTILLNDGEYGRRYFPEPSDRVLKGIGWYFTGSSFLGYMILTITEVPYGLSLFEDTFHMMIYFLFGSFGVVNLLEAYSKVPKDSSRLTFAINLAFEGLLLLVHSNMKKSNVATLQHQLVAFTSFLSSFGLFLSIQYPNWLIPYVVYLVGFIWQSIWWITIGLCFLVEDLDTGDMQFISP